MARDLRGSLGRGAASRGWRNSGASSFAVAVAVAVAVTCNTSEAGKKWDCTHKLREG